MSSRYPYPLPWDINQIMQMIPHRYPFLLVDRVERVVDAGTDDERTGSEIFAIKNVTANEPFFVGHFPDRPIMPGVLVIEALAQASAIVNYRPLPAGKTKWEFYFAGINNVKFRRPVIPGDQLSLYARVYRDRKSLCVFETKATVGDELVAEAQILAKMLAV